jgi:hypothetical protein
MSNKSPPKNTPVRVEFAGAVLDGLLVKGVAYVALRPIVEGIGLDFGSQLKRVKKDEVLNSVVVELTTTGADGKQYEMTCIPEKYLQGWLFKIEANKVKPAIRSKVIHYQRECYDVLHQAFTQGKAETHYRVLAVDSKRASGKLLADVLNDVLIMDGKQPKQNDFRNEHRLVNWALTGSFSALDESTLTTVQIKHLSLIRRRDAVLVMRGLSYADRKAWIKQYADSLHEQGRLAA